MVAILQTEFLNSLCGMKIVVFVTRISLKFVSEGQLTKVTIGLKYSENHYLTDIFYIFEF